MSGISYIFGGSAPRHPLVFTDISRFSKNFVRFFLAINISKLSNIICNNFFKFVPAPPSGKFDHIYTDQELYDAFNLPQKYRDVIEAVIKERK